MTGDPKAFLEEALSRQDSDPISISIRQLLSHWGAKRRGFWVVSRIDDDLTEVGLTTQPSFKEGWIDTRVELVRMQQPSTAVDVTASDSSTDDATLIPGAMLRVGDLPSAHSGVVSIELSADLHVAQSIMLRHDFSQIAVLSGERNLRGALTWESIAVAHLRDSSATLRDAMVPTDPVRLGEDLLDLIPRVVRDGFVFVSAPDRRLNGIVTMADLSLEFSNLARPYFMLGEIERRLRRILDETMPSAVLEAAVAPSDSGRSVQSAQDLTFGEYVRILENPTNWALLRWTIDRSTFVGALDEVKDLRNDVMHFSPDPFGEDELAVLRNFIRWLRVLDPRP